MQGTNTDEAGMEATVDSSDDFYASLFLVLWGSFLLLWNLPSALSSVVPTELPFSTFLRRRFIGGLA